MNNELDFDVTYDVAVIGGGIAGVAAAIQAARSGMKTVLIEKTVLFGGLATTGLVNVYLPLCDGNGKQVSFGLTEELLRASLNYGPGEIPEKWQKNQNAPEKDRFRCIFSPASFILAIDEMLEEAGVELWLDTLVCAAEVEENKIVAAICENTSGRGRIRAKQFVDATGSSLFARRAGIAVHDEWNFLTAWIITYDKTQEQTQMSPYVHVYVHGTPWDPAKVAPEHLYRGEDGKQVSDFVLKSRRWIREDYKKAYAAEPEKYNRNDYYALKLPAMPQFRKIYSIDAKYVLGDNENNKRFEDSIGLAADWRKSGPVWEIPYRSLIPEKNMGGYLAAGRCTGAKGDAWEITRVIPPAAMTGQAAGLAAAMCIKNGVEPYELDVTLLQKELKENCGFVLHLDEIGLRYDK